MKRMFERAIMTKADLLLLAAALCAALFWRKARKVIRRWIVKNVRAHWKYW